MKAKLFCMWAGFIMGLLAMDAKAGKPVDWVCFASAIVLLTAGLLPTGKS